MDTEAHECRAVMGSQGIFSDPRFNIIAISIKWNYVKDGRVSKLCPLPMLKSFVRLLVLNSFEPRDHKSGENLDPDESVAWPHGIHTFWTKRKGWMCRFSNAFCCSVYGFQCYGF